MNFQKLTRRLTKLVPGSAAKWTWGVRAEPERVVLGVAEGVTPSPKPPVRIFVGTEPEQYRAERILIWSILQVRDPSRVYEIYLMKDLIGFDRRLWLTGFTNYRLAIPHLAGRKGRAIYNDVDQIYLGDPAELFDTDMKSHGYLALSQKDTAVMLIDCERMAPAWPLEEVKLARRKDMEAKAAKAGLWGALERKWHARDEEYIPGVSKLIHYTTIHAQPWQPFPQVYVYLHNPVGHVWHELERSADRAGFQMFTAQHPSSRYDVLLERSRAAHFDATTGNDAEPTLRGDGLEELLRHPSVKTILEYRLVRAGTPDPSRVAGLPVRPDQKVTHCDLAEDPLSREAREQFDLVVCCGELDFAATEDVPWMAAALFARSRRFVYVKVADYIRSRTLPGSGELGNEPHTDSWWSAQLSGASAHHPRIGWLLALEAENGRTWFRQGGRIHDGPPTVWVLADDKAGHSTQSLGLADALGWPYEVKQLYFNSFNRLSNRILGARLIGLDRRRSDALAAPWPDLVIATGRRAAPVARFIGKRSQGRTRLVQLGRKGGDDPAAFDIVVTCSHFRLPVHPRRIETVAPINAVTQDRLAQAAARWGDLFEGAPRPRVALIAGGTCALHELSARTARQMAEDVRRFAEEAGGSVFAITSPRTGADATAALIDGLGRADCVHVWKKGERDNPYIGYLACADVLVVTGESESMLAEAACTGKPLYIYPLPEKPRPWRTRFSEWVYERATSRPRKEKGTVRPQQGLEYVCARLIEKGVVRPLRDLARMHEGLVRAGVARRFGESLSTEPPRPLHEIQDVAHRVRELMGYVDETPKGAGEGESSRLRVA